MKSFKRVSEYLNYIGFKHCFDEVKCYRGTIYVLDIKGFNRFNKITLEEKFLLENNLSKGLFLKVKRTFLKIKLWEVEIQGKY